MPRRRRDSGTRTVGSESTGEPLARGPGGHIRLQTGAADGEAVASGPRRQLEWASALLHNSQSIGFGRVLDPAPRRDQDLDSHCGGDIGEIVQGDRQRTARL